MNSNQLGEIILNFKKSTKYISIYELKNQKYALKKRTKIIFGNNIYKIFFNI